MIPYPEPDKICRQILEAVGHSRPPVDLDTVCSLWPDLSIIEDDLDKDGYLVPLGIHGADLIIRRGDPSTRKRFTVAHELGHWVLAHLDGGMLSLGAASKGTIAFRTEHKRQTPEEMWCNRFAASLLMPLNDLETYLQDKRQALATHIVKGHLVFDVSEEAFLLRVTKATRISVLEVATFGPELRLRRQFLSELDPLNEPQLLIEQLTLQRASGLSVRRCHTIGHQTVYVEQVRQSPSGSTLMLCIVPSSSSLFDEHRNQPSSPECSRDC